MSDDQTDETAQDPASTTDQAPAEPETDAAPEEYVAPGSPEDLAARAALSDGELSDDFILYLFRWSWFELVQVLAVEGIEGAATPPRVIRVRHAPSPGLTTFATLTNSRFVDPDGREAPNAEGDPVPVHVEYSMICKLEHEAEAWPGIRAVLERLYAGDTFPEGVTGGPIFGNQALGATSSASHVLVVPNRWGFGQQPMRTRTLEMLQLLPITPDEEAYCADHGYSGILGALNGMLFDPTDLHRESIVRRGPSGWLATVGDGADAPA